MNAFFITSANQIIRAYKQSYYWIAEQTDVKKIMIFVNV